MLMDQIKEQQMLDRKTPEVIQAVKNGLSSKK